MSIDQYIVCFENCTLRHIEALAMLGLIVEAKQEDCERPRFKKITATLYDGRVVTSTCYLDEEVAHSLRIIQIYIGVARKNNAIGKLAIVEGRAEE